MLLWIEPAGERSSSSPLTVNEKYLFWELHFLCGLPIELRCTLLNNQIKAIGALISPPVDCSFAFPEPAPGQKGIITVSNMSTRRSIKKGPEMNTNNPPPPHESSIMLVGGGGYGYLRWSSLAEKSLLLQARFWILALGRAASAEAETGHMGSWSPHVSFPLSGGKGFYTGGDDK